MCACAVPPIVPSRPSSSSVPPTPSILSPPLPLCDEKRRKEESLKLFQCSMYPTSKATTFSLSSPPPRKKKLAPSEMGKGNYFSSQEDMRAFSHLRLRHQSRSPPPAGWIWRIPLLLLPISFPSLAGNRVGPCYVRPPPLPPLASCRCREEGRKERGASIFVFQLPFVCASKCIALFNQN